MKRTLLFGFAIPLSVFAVVGIFVLSESLFNVKTQVSEAKSSVELGLLELSPKGEAGGFAMPASGGSEVTATCVLSFSPSTIAPGGSTNVTATLQYPAPYTHSNGFNVRTSPENSWYSLYQAGMAAALINIDGNNTGWTSGSHTLSNYTPSGAPNASGHYNFTGVVSWREEQFGVHYGAPIGHRDRWYWEFCQGQLAVDSIQNSLKARVIGSGIYSGSDFTIDDGEEIELRWNSSGATSCTVTAGPPDFSTGGNTSGTDSTVTEPTAGNSTTYAIECTDGSLTVSDSIIITNSGVPASASSNVRGTLEICDSSSIDNCIVRTASEGANASGNINVGTQNLRIRWISSDADTCSVDPSISAGTGPDNPGFPNPVSVTGPASGASQNYVLNYCENTGTGDRSGSVTITVNNVSAIGSSCGANFNLDASPRIVRRGGDTTLSWSNSTDASTCTLTGGGITPEVSTPNACSTTHTLDITGLQNTTTYTLSCDDGSTDTVTVQVVPIIDER